MERSGTGHHHTFDSLQPTAEVREGWEQLVEGQDAEPCLDNHLSHHSIEALQPTFKVPEEWKQLAEGQAAEPRLDNPGSYPVGGGSPEPPSHTSNRGGMVGNCYAEAAWDGDGDGICVCDQEIRSEEENGACTGSACRKPEIRRHPGGTGNRAAGREREGCGGFLALPRAPARFIEWESRLPAETSAL